MIIEETKSRLKMTEFKSEPSDRKLRVFLGILVILLFGIVGLILAVFANKIGKKIIIFKNSFI